MRFCAKAQSSLDPDKSTRATNADGNAHRDLSNGTCLYSAYYVHLFTTSMGNVDALLFLPPNNPVSSARRTLSHCFMESASNKKEREKNTRVSYFHLNSLLIAAKPSRRNNADAAKGQPRIKNGRSRVSFNATIRDNRPTRNICAWDLPVYLLKLRTREA